MLPEEDTICIFEDRTEIKGVKPYYLFENGLKTEVDVVDSCNVLKHNKVLFILCLCYNYFRWFYDRYRLCN